MTSCENLARLEIESEIEHFDGVLPERDAIGCRALLAGYLDAGTISTSLYDELIAMVPAVRDDPTLDIAGPVRDRLPRIPRRPRPMSDELASELKMRIQRHLDGFGGQMPERVAIAWRCYLHALSRSDVIDLDMYGELIDLLPYVPDSPLTDSHDDVELWGGRIHNDIERFGGPLSEPHAIAWRGFLTGLWEWDRINTRTYHELLAMVPVDDDPSQNIWREHDRARWHEEGRRFAPGEVAADLRARIRQELERFGGDMPEGATIAWKAYLWGTLLADPGTGPDIITNEEYHELVELLPARQGKEVAELFRHRTD